ncbi:hypothetical protein J5N97_016584 [Dioscorea zingiberensis]|uniref:t-SNARE coiled-coil homology domain-containing protein n=1 Tax=Dioscorea zingiberensis TaxID=325984 RepID=A0A9D5CKK7_9LILI|nr:hypothetical protein J5N97_016584 [Dioscorea zingiberensis]
MSFQDLGSSTIRTSVGGGGAKADVAAGIFQTATAVAGFRRLVDAVGSPKDSPEHRRTLQEARKSVAQLVKHTSSKLKGLSDANRDADPSKRMDEAKLARDFQTVLLDFQKAQKLAVERETAYAMPSSLSSDEHKTQDTDADEESQQLLWEQKRQEVISLDGEISFNEALIEEREQGIQDIDSDVVQINEIFKDLAVLIDEQHPTIDDIEIQIEAASTSTTQARDPLAKGYKSSRSNVSSYCWVMIIFVVVLTTLLMVLILY